MADGSSAEVALRDVIIVGGGCYGTFYAGQLLHAAKRGKVSYRTLLIVDHNPQCRFALEIGAQPSCRLITQEWTDFFDGYLGDKSDPGVEPGDAIVPSPLMPHLMYEWLVRRARSRWPGRLVETRPVPAGPGTPYDVTAPDGTRYVSYADWICPTHCIEPATCPVIRAPRTWEMSEALEGLTARLAQAHTTAGPVLFVCKHRVYGVGMFDVSTVLAGDRAVASAGAGGTPVDVLVGTISSCHGAVNLLHLG
jgi:hypothetical protein